jgi:hypothetical protein
MVYEHRGESGAIRRREGHQRRGERFQGDRIRVFRVAGATAGATSQWRRRNIPQSINLNVTSA